MTDFIVQFRMRYALTVLLFSIAALGQSTPLPPFGACEGFLLDRLRPNWRDPYLQNLFTLEPYFN